jgi:ADP-ribosylglycohydrolase
VREDAIRGCLFGMAIGDALGAPTEFMSMAEIIRRFPPHGFPPLIGTPARVTDDTQMALAVGAALLSAPRPYAPDSLAGAFGAAFITWYHDPQNNRAPGMTCMGSTARLISGIPWRDATDIHSKGCGANMRVMPVALLPLDDAVRAGIAQLQAAITHAHPAALAASDLTAWVITWLANGGDPAHLLAAAETYARAQLTTYHADWLGDLWDRSAFTTPEVYIAYGWETVRERLARVVDALATGDPDADPCLLTGAGWTADDALATALHCFLRYPDDPVTALGRAAATSGDSDSIACITGAFAGARHGMSGLPADWVARIEYHAALTRLADGLIGLWAGNA